MSRHFARRRRLGSTGHETPLLVPSYSSRGFTPLRRYHEALKDATTRISLVSAYDIHHAALPIEAVYDSDLVFVDSGGYEAYASSELSHPEPWSLTEYRAVLDRLEDRSAIVAVSFDYEQRQATAEQLANALDLCRDYPRYAWAWLAKPEAADRRLVNVKAIVDALPEARPFAALGVTEDELGPSLGHRLTNLRTMREGLNRMAPDMPIHIFGCLDPVAIPYYLLAGADIFDGLQWLRSVCRTDGLLRLSSALIRDGHITDVEEEARMAYRRLNVSLLHEMQTKWAKDIIVEDGDLPKRLGVHPDVWRKVSGTGE